MENETRYSPARCIGCDMKVVSGNPDPEHVGTSFVERQNLTMRMHMPIHSTDQWFQQGRRPQRVTARGSELSPRSWDISLGSVTRLEGRK
jgi:hypothetical protein